MDIVKKNREVIPDFIYEWTGEKAEEELSLSNDPWVFQGIGWYKEGFNYTLVLPMVSRATLN